MNRFEGVQFKGTFRSYQQRVLDNVEQYLADGKVNIVAAPGSGKTVLGLELIRKLGQPCLILSPTTAIREQWGQRFKELFLEDESCFEELFSTDLHQVKLINSITYQALYTAMERIVLKEDGEIDCSDIDLLKTLKEYNIKTICLDEAHHLRNEWQKALEKFMGILDSDVKLISLTATPPYDSEGFEWKRYYDICGEIDEEIFVPELVAQENLCPHQDYVYFNYPTQKETIALWEHHKHALEAVEELGKLDWIRLVDIQLSIYQNEMFKYPKEFVALFVLLQYYGVLIEKKLIKTLTGKSDLPKLELSYLETALQFLLENKYIYLRDEDKQEIRNVLKKHQVYINKKVCLVLNESLRRTLVSSVGKLESIAKIAKHEYQSMGKSLRMLVLTDYIRNDKENLRKIGTGKSFNAINVISIFETLRRMEIHMNIGVLSGSLIILPQSIDLPGIMLEKEPIPGTDYCIVNVDGATHEAVELVSKLFRDGKLQILIGTKSLLGEGWDEPCINSLILASFVGSYVSSNQMRGRAIRIDRGNPDKAANIWHLVTLEPGSVVAETGLERLAADEEKEKQNLQSWDFDIVKRRFNTFMGPNYETGEIESGIGRITLIQPPFDMNGIVQINRKMLELSEEREAMREMWKKQLESKKFSVVMETNIPQEKCVPPFSYMNKAGFAVYGFALFDVFVIITNLYKLIQAIHLGTNVSDAIMWFLFSLLLGGVLLYLVWKMTQKLLLHLTPVRSLETLGEVVAKTLADCRIISQEARVYVEKEVASGKDVTVGVQLRNASMHDQNIFNTAMTELLAPIDNPRYLLIRKKVGDWYQYKYSFACPAVIGRKKQYVEVLAHHLKKSLGFMDVVYAHNDKGRKLLMQCRRRSFITQSEAWKSDTALLEADKKYIVAQEDNKGEI